MFYRHSSQVRMVSSALAAVLFCAFIVVTRATAAEVKLSPPGILFVTGPINSADVETISSALPKLFRADASQTVTIVIDSSGGDVFAAMKIGRLLRNADAHVSTCNCRSACVLILAAAVERTNCAGQAKVGVHRLYSTVVSTEKTTDQIRNERRAVLKQLREYLEEMSVSVALVDLMEGIPPEEIRYLTESEQQQYGLLGSDPAWNEKQVARQASFYGLTSAELRRRDAMANTRCVYRGTEQYPPDFFFENCRNVIRWGLTEEQYKLKEQRTRVVCNGLGDADFRACVIREMQASPK